MRQIGCPVLSLKIRKTHQTLDDYSFGQAEDSLMPIPFHLLSLFTYYKCVFIARICAIELLAKFELAIKNVLPTKL